MGIDNLENGMGGVEVNDSTLDTFLRRLKRLIKN